MKYPPRKIVAGAIAMVVFIAMAGLWFSYVSRVDEVLRIGKIPMDSTAFVEYADQSKLYAVKKIPKDLHYEVMERFFTELVRDIGRENIQIVTVRNETGQVLTPTPKNYSEIIAFYESYARHGKEFLSQFALEQGLDVILFWEQLKTDDFIKATNDTGSTLPIEMKLFDANNDVVRSDSFDVDLEKWVHDRFVVMQLISGKFKALLEDSRNTR